MKAIYEKRMTEKQAQENNISLKEVEQKVQEVYNSYTEDGIEFESDDAKWGRAYRRVRHAFSLRQKKMKNSEEGMIVCRLRNNDFNRVQYDIAMSTMLSKGADVAIQQNNMNQDQQPLYIWGSDKGKVILNDDKEPGRPSATGSAIGYTFSRDDDGNIINITPRLLIISRDRVDDDIPICQTGRYVFSVTDSGDEKFKIAPNNHKAFFNDASVSHGRLEGYNGEQVQDILGQWNKAFDNNFTVISTMSELVEFGLEHCAHKDNKDAKYDFCVIPGTVVGIESGQQYQDAKVTLEFFDYENEESSLVTCYVNDAMMQGLNMKDDDQGIFVLQSYSTNIENGHKWHLGGFLHITDDVQIEKFFGVNMEDFDE